MERPQRSSGFRGSWLVVVLASACASPSPVGVDAAAADAAEEADAATIADVARDDALDAAPRPDAQVAPDGTTLRDASDVPDGTPTRDAPDAADATTTRDAPDATDAPDAPAAGDAPDAADATRGCAVVVSSADTAAGQVGGNGGSPAMDIACPGGDEIIGVAARVSDGPTAAGSRRSIVGLSAVCAAVRFEGGSPAVGPETLVEVQGSGAFGWTPATLTAPARCPPGWVVSGMQASRGTNGELFIDVTVTCAELRADSTATGMTRTVYVEGSLREDPTYDTVVCPAGQVVRRFGTRTGAGFDAVTVYCAAPGCGP